MRFHSIKTAGILSAVILIVSLFSTAGAASPESGYFTSLQRQLIRDGFASRTITGLYARPEVSFNMRGVSGYFVHNESKLNYDQFLEPGPIRQARNYMIEHETALVNAERAFGVHRQVITAILLVETRLGTYVGSSLVFNILSTMSALSDPNVRNSLWQYVSGTTNLTRQQFDEKANQKAGWAYQELKAFLKYTDQEKLDPLGITGSYAGAMGFCQFMPSNILILAKDGNADGKINLFDHPDAIMSIASYLNHYGWYSGIDAKKAWDVVYHYNHSKYYVNTVLKIMGTLKGKTY